MEKDRHRLTIAQRRITERTLVDKVYHLLLEDILFGHISMGTVLNESELCDIYGASRSVIREVIVKLSTAGILEKKPHQPAKVRVFTEKDIRDLFNVRLYLELSAIETIDVLPDDKYIYLKSLIENPDFGRNRYIFTDRTFHEEIIKLANNEILLNLYLQIRDQVQIARALMTERRPERVMEANKEHHILLDTLKAGDKETAVKVTKIHVISARDESILWIRESANKSQERG
jgi:DNA-binding GntR family transcriptional regulator